jgi:hypothetical protein
MTTGRLMRGFTVAVVLVLPACTPGGVPGSTAASPSPVSPSPPSPSPAGVGLSLLRTGGFAGVRDEVVVDDSGGWSLTDRTGGHRVGRLTGEQLEELRRLESDPRLSAESARSQEPSRCTDSFGYTLTVHGMRIDLVDCPTDADVPPAAAAVVRLVAQVVWA